MKKASLLLTSLLGALLSLHAMPMEGKLGERSEGSSGLPYQQERLRESTTAATVEEPQRGNSEDFSVAEEPGDILISQEEDLKRRSSQYRIQAVKAYKKGNINEGITWDNAGNSCNDAAESQEKAIDAEQSGNKPLAAKWREVAKLQEKSVKPFIKAAKAYNQGNTSEGIAWNNAGKGFRHVAKNQEKSIDAEQTGNKSLAAKWREVAALCERSIEPFTKAAEAYNQGNTNEGENWNNAGYGFGHAAGSQGKAIDAEQSGDTALAAKLREVAALCKRSIEPFTKAAEAYAAKSRDEGDNWKDAAINFINAAKARFQGNLIVVAKEIAKANNAIRIAEWLVLEQTAAASGAAEPSPKKGFFK